MSIKKVRAEIDLADLTECHLRPDVVNGFAGLGCAAKGCQDPLIKGHAWYCAASSDNHKHFLCQSCGESVMTMLSKAKSDKPIRVMSFGFKYGVPDGTFTRMDLRILQNPFSNPKLRKLDGRDAAVQEAVFRCFKAQNLFTQAQRKAALGQSIAFGCFGGRHRSVAFAERLAKELGITPEHRDLVKHTQVALPEIANV